MGVRVSEDDLPDKYKGVVPAEDLPDQYRGTVPAGDLPSQEPKTQADYAIPGGNVSPSGLLQVIKHLAGMAVEGGPQALGAAIGGSLGSPLGPAGVLGGAALGAAGAGTLQDVYKQLTQGEPAPGLGKATLRRASDVAMGVTQEAAPLVAKSVSEAQNLGGNLTSRVVTKEVSDKLMRGIKPINRKVEFRETMQRAVPEVNTTATAQGKPIESLNDIAGVISESKKRVWDQYNQLLKDAETRTKAQFQKGKEFGEQAQKIQSKLKLQDEPSAIRPLQEEKAYLTGEAAKSIETGMEIGTIDGNKIADAMTSVITKRLEIQNPNAAQKIRDIADTYRGKRLSLRDAEDFLQGANNDLHAYYAKTKTNRNVALKDPEQAYVVKEAETLREELYKKLDEIPGKDASELKRRYGSLTSLEEEVLRRKNIAERQNPDSLSEQFSKWHGYGTAAEGILTGSPGKVIRGLAEKEIARQIRKANTTDELIKKAFAAYNSGKVQLPVDEFLMKMLPVLGRGFTSGLDSSTD